MVVSRRWQRAASVRESRPEAGRERRPAPDPSSVVVRSLSALGLAGGVLATVLVLQGPAVEHDVAEGTRLTTPTGALLVGTPSVTLVHQANDMVGMPASTAHRTGGEVSVPVTLTNTSSRPIRYAPDEFQLVVDGKTVEPAGGAEEGPEQELRPDAAISLRLTFPQGSLVHGGQLRYTPAGGPALTTPLDPVTGSEAAEGHHPTGAAPVAVTADDGHGHTGDLDHDHADDHDHGVRR